MHIATERLQLRPLNLGDGDFIVDLVNSEGWLQFIGERNVTDNTTAERYIVKILKTPNFDYTVLELKESGKPIGIISFMKREDEELPDFGFALLPEYEKKGYAFEASKAYVEELVHSKEFEKVNAITKPENQKSIKLLGKLHFSFIGNRLKNEELLSYYQLKLWA